MRHRLAMRSQYVAFLVRVVDEVGFDAQGQLRGRICYPADPETYGALSGRAWGPIDDRTGGWRLLVEY